MERERPDPGDLILRILHDLEIREDILDVRLFEETHTAPDDIRDLALDELHFELSGLVVGAIEHRDIMERQSLVMKLHDALYDK